MTTSLLLHRAELAPLTPEDVLEHFLGGRSRHTRTAYRLDLEKFAAHIGTDLRSAIGVLLACDAGQGNALALGWLNAMTEARLSSATRARRLGTLRSFTRAARMVGAISWHVEVRRPNVRPYRDTRGPTEEIVHKMFAACGEDLLGLRDRIVLGLLFGLGLRRFEVAKAKLGDLCDGRLEVVGKGESKRELDLPRELQDALRQWIKERPFVEGVSPAEQPLICQLSRNGYGAALTVDGVNHVVREIGKRADAKVWPHALRHAAITIGLKDHDVQEMQGFSRHEDLKTLMIYADNRKNLGSVARADLVGKLFAGKEEK